MSLIFTCLKLTDGTTTLDLLDATKWGLEAGGYLPSMAPLAAGLLGRSGAMDDVDETMALQVRGTGAGSSDAARAIDAPLKFMANLLALWTMMDKVARFGRGDPSAPAVTLLVCLAGSTVATPSVPHKVLLLGPPGLDPEQATFLIPNQGLNSTLFSDNYGSVVLRFRRRGMFTPLLTAQTSGSAATPAGTLVVQSTGLTAVAVPSPTYVQITGWSPTTTPTLPPTYLLVAEANNIGVQEAEGGADGVKWTVVAESAGNPTFARNGNILRYIPTDTLPSTSYLSALPITTTYTRVAVLAVVRNTGGKNFRLKAHFTAGLITDIGGVAETPEVLIDASTANPRVVNLGIASLRGGVTKISWVAAVDDITGSPHLDIDYYAVVNLNDETSSVLFLDTADFSQFDVTGGIIIDPATLTELAPSVTAVGGGVLPLSPHGNATLLTKGSTITTLFMATGGGAPTAWRFSTVAGTPALLNLTWYFRRHQSYILPV